MKRLRCLIASFVLVSLTGCPSDENQTAPVSFHPRTIEEKRIVLPVNLSSLLVLIQVGRQETSWFGADYKNYHDFLESAASEILRNNGFQIVVPREYLQDIDRETRKSQEEISNDYALHVGRQQAASGVMVVTVGILEDTRVPPQHYYSSYRQWSSIAYMGYYSQYYRTWGYRWPNSNTNSQPRSQSQHYVQVIVAARVLDVEAGTLVHSENATYEYWSPSSVASVAQEAVKRICRRFSKS